MPAARTAVDALVAAPETIVALVSGRSLSDLRIIAEHDDDSRILLAGSHGAEFWVPGEGRDRARATAPAMPHCATGCARTPRRRRATSPGCGSSRRPSASACTPADRMPRPPTPRTAGSTRSSPPRHRTGGGAPGHNIVEYAFRHEGKDTAVAALQGAHRRHRRAVRRRRRHRRGRPAQSRPGRPRRARRHAADGGHRDRARHPGDGRPARPPCGHADGAAGIDFRDAPAL